ncbi:MAG: PRC-barrel domain-containing protein [Bacteroidota bacterium]|nr:PRC-barrel domain-containing protein [Bacteroidota bacterium]
MLRNINSLVGFSIGATDGEIGKVEECYFDDTTWTVRYIIVKTGGWLGRKVLISPEAILHPDWDQRTLPVNLTREQVKHSPDIDTDKPISRQEEDALFSYYPWQNYYDAGLFGEGIGMMGIYPVPPIVDVNEVDENKLEERNVNQPKPTTHLRSTHEVKGYAIHATDGEIGEVADFIFNEDDWSIHFLAVHTGNFFSGKKVLLSPAWIKDVQWDMQEVIVNVTVDAVKNSPEYDSSKPLDPGYSKDLHEHYGLSQKEV